jgi:hypothetical protein
MKTFISYRREDGQYIADAIRDRLAKEFGRGNVFIDIDSIPVGLDFRRVLREGIDRCNVLLVVIGPGWLSATNSNGERRIDDPADFVRIEIEAALEREIPIIPLLIKRATVPPEANLPSSLQPLAYRNGLAIRPGNDFPRDMNDLIVALRDMRSPTPSVRRGNSHVESLLSKWSAVFLPRLRSAAVESLLSKLPADVPAPPTSFSPWLWVKWLPRAYFGLLRLQVSKPSFRRTVAISIAGFIVISIVMLVIAIINNISTQGAR